MLDAAIARVVIAVVRSAVVMVMSVRRSRSAVVMQGAEADSDASERAQRHEGQHGKHDCCFKVARHWIDASTPRSKAKPRYDHLMETVELKVEGMDCQGCVKSVTRMLSGVAGVQKVDVSLAEGRATVTYDPAKAQVADMKRAVERAGYKAP